jgi:thioredoxin reductase (NADPH)
MSKPVILLVDDEPHVLNAVDRDLRRHFSERYRMVKAASGP